eukprot:scaffold7100_cov43-Phaeocystis_antarctica.AAC.2
MRADQPQSSTHRLRPPMPIYMCIPPLPGVRRPGPHLPGAPAARAVPCPPRGVAGGDGKGRGVEAKNRRGVLVGCGRPLVTGQAAVRALDHLAEHPLRVELGEQRHDAVAWPPATAGSWRHRTAEAGVYVQGRAHAMHTPPGGLHAAEAALRRGSCARHKGGRGAAAAAGALWLSGACRGGGVEHAARAARARAIRPAMPARRRRASGARAPPPR